VALPGERRSPAGRTAQPGPRACSPVARKLRMFARWPHLHRPDPSPSAGAGPAGRTAGRRGHGHSRRPGAWPGAWSRPTGARVALSLSGSCNLGHFLSWTRMIPSTATMWCIVFRSDAATGGPQAAPTQLGPCPPDADSDWACRSDRPAPSNGRADALPALTQLGPRASRV
jgi:hypothetical protein